MTAGTQTFGLPETLLTPRALPPPPTRHAILAFLLALTAILQIGTAGWSDIHNGPEGIYAAVARDMVRNETWVPPHETAPPLFYWLLVGSCKIFGLSAAAMRVPVAVAMLAGVALTFLIGERLAGWWRGFAAGLIHLCSLGSFVVAREVTPGPFQAALVAAVIYCALRGYQKTSRRALWFCGVSLGSAFLYLTGGIWSLLLPVTIFAALSFLFREARLRFAKLLRWPQLLLFFAIVGSWHLWLASRGPNFFSQFAAQALLTPGEGVELPRFLCTQALSLCPALLLILPGLLFSWRKIARPHEFAFADALPLFWIAFGFFPLLCSPARQDYQAIVMWGGFALAAAWAWERTPPALRFAGLGLASIFGIAFAILALTNAFGRLPLLPSLWFRGMTAGVGIVFVLACAVACFFLKRGHEERALALILLAMVPVGLSVAEGTGRYSAYLSFAEAARSMESSLPQGGEVYFEGTPNAGSSLSFYLDRPPIYLAPGGAVDPLEASLATPDPTDRPPLFLIVPKRRVPYWQQRLTERFHMYHQLATCGDYVVISDRP
ncbi:MAG: glycosyltransferase family 39 protein [Chthoniobacterales bacterium]